MNKGTVFYIGGFEMPDKNAAAHRVLNNSKIFHELGYKVVFCGIYNDEKYPNKIDSFDNFPRANPKSIKNWFFDSVNITPIIRTIESCQNVVMVIAYNMHFMQLNKLKKYCNKSEIKIISDCTEWYDYKMTINPIQWYKQIDTAITMKIEQKKLDGFIVISKYLENYYKKINKSIIVLPPLVDIEQNIWNINSNQRHKIEALQLRNLLNLFVLLEVVHNIFNRFKCNKFVILVNT